MQQEMRNLYLFSVETPGGELFSNVTDDQIEELLGEGWANSPDELDLPKKAAPTIPADRVKDAKPNDLVNLVKGLGYKVLTDIELQAEIGKASGFSLVDVSTEQLMTTVSERLGEDAFIALTLEQVNDETFLAEAERRGLKPSDDAVKRLNELQSQFELDPKKLNKDELVEFGNNGFKLGLRSNMNEDTLIAKITEVMTAP